MAITLTRCDPVGGWTVLAIAGHVDTAAAPTLEQAFRAQLGQGTQLALELSGVSYLCSAGLRAILAITQELGPLHARLVLVNPHAAVRDTLEISGFSRFLPVVDSLEALS